MKSKGINKATARSLEKLATIIAPFEEHWKDWIHSEYSPLTVKEVGVIESYQEHVGHHYYAQANQLTTRHVSVVYNKGVRKLQLPQTRRRYEKWCAYQALLREGIVAQGKDIESVIDAIGNIRISLPLFLKLYRTLKGKEPMSFDEEELSALELLPQLSSMQQHEFRKQHLCFSLFLEVPQSNGRL